MLPYLVDITSNLAQSLLKDYWSELSSYVNNHEVKFVYFKMDQADIVPQIDDIKLDIFDLSPIMDAVKSSFRKYNQLADDVDESTFNALRSTFCRSLAKDKYAVMGVEMLARFHSPTFNEDYPLF